MKMQHTEDDISKKERYYEVVIHEYAGEDVQSSWSSHEQAGLLFLLSGDCLFETSKVSIPICESHILVISPGEVHQLKRHTQDYFTSMTILLDSDIEIVFRRHGSEAGHSFLAESGKTFVIDLEPDATQWMMLFAKKLYKETIHHQPENDFYSQSLVNLIVFEMMKLIQYANRVQDIVPVRNNPVRNNYEDSAIVKKAIQYINLNYQEDINLEKIAKVLWVNPSYLSRQFKSKVGVSITDFTTSKRVFAAKNLLIFTDLQISDVALSVGYGSIPYFNSVFKKSTGFNPTQFRKIKKQSWEIQKNQLQE